MKQIKVQKKPTTSDMLEITLKEFKKLFGEGKVSVSKVDREAMIKESKNPQDDDIVGYVAGDIKSLTEPDKWNNDLIPDLWFVNKDYFINHYTKL